MSVIFIFFTNYFKEKKNNQLYSSHKKLKLNIKNKKYNAVSPEREIPNVLLEGDSYSPPLKNSGNELYTIC